ncbi:right-handed parallel beta-helix repeat-containing protein [Spirosoma sp. RP8]|uniref:Right-handed parallel beta-helix repeat-containing protein n=1 Tax=Spirosoma liriopis TaxID=2937440 RepID=A0ABT0HKB0_9BACT|nr:right-handed parallel beta-helix repeat-containing protein [Spirosoma liriopis]MCK8492307.1 right-handed parallel beta-helix repeat-containing protein [Spirosoma liriopis]
MKLRRLLPLLIRMKPITIGIIVCLTACSTPAQQTTLEKETTATNDKKDVEPSNSYSKVSQVRNLKTSPDRLSLAIDGQSDLFYYDPKDKSTPDNGSTVIVTNQGKRYKRLLEGPINAQYHFAAKGDGVTDDTKSLQAAINAACKANNPAAKKGSSPANGSNTVYIPHGSYKITNEILIQGSCTILMEQASSYGGTRIQQMASGKHLFHIVKDNDGSSSGVHIIGGILKGSASTTSAEVALIFGGEGALNANNNSTYIDNVWFQTPEQYGINFLRGDDINIRNCTFDVSAYHSIKMGSSSNAVTNSSIVGCTFYDIRAGAIDLINVDGLIVNTNRVYNNAQRYTPYFLNANGKSVKGLQISNNYLDYVNRLVFVNHNAEDVLISNNMHRHGSGRSIEIGGGQSVSTIYITNNVLSGDYSKEVNLGGANVPDSPIFCYSTGLANSRITGNTFRHIGKGKGLTPMLLTDKRTINNFVYDNMIIGFDNEGQIANPTLNRTK